ncbi:DMT family transporter [Curvibacter sp. CHRR-16]|uniref:DMT family transporter n=1 Tax=Curvibacter sp. CHRR-16 TaxID=2835872 RepID=UPI001BD92C1E|nr:DMT family transporter [Curvibacter sp. CHRR-16]MBT0569800.1 DMT family transporter [Curvibacter sp. CHRR-16]
MTTPNTTATATTSATTTPPWVLDFVLLAAIWGSSFLFMRMGAKEFGALPTAGLRVGIAALFLLPILAYQGQLAGLRQHWKLLFAVGLLNSALPFACFAYALLSIPTGLTSIINATVPLFGAVVAWVWLHDRPQGLRVLGLLVGFAGVALLAWSKSSFTPSASGGASGTASTATGWAVLASLAACLFYGIAASFTRRHLAGVPSMVLATGSQVGAAVGLLPFTLWYWPSQTVSASAWLALLALGVLCTGIAYVIFFRLIARRGPAKALTVTYAIPVFGVAYGVLLLGETVTGWMLVCGPIILLGTALSSGLIGGRVTR